MKINKKYSIFIAVPFYISAFSQNIEKDTSINSNALQKIISQQKLTAIENKSIVKNLVAKGYKEFIDDGVNEKQLIGADENGNPLYYTTLNSNASKKIKTNTLYSGGSLGLNISGQGMRIGQWDYSKPRLNHQLIAGKVIYDTSQNQTISRHSTHIMGTMIGNNYSNSEATGVAYDATSAAYDWVNDVQEMTEEAIKGLLIANNSYGFDPMYYQTYQFGKYNETARNWDRLMYNAPHFQIVKAVGNARGLDPTIVPQVTAKNGYDLLEGAGIAKNVLVVTSVDKNENPIGDSDFNISSFSSYGSTDDGRIKPDIAAQGQGVFSAIETYNSAYGTYNGTSSATASVSASIALLQQYWKSINPVSNYLWSSSLRAIISHTANDKGSLGPDYIYGWGLMDTERAARLIYNHTKSTLVKEANLQQGGEYRLYVVASEFENQPLVATLAWTDPEGNIVNAIEDDPTPALVNDLDITILKKDNNGNFQTYYPWKLGGMQNLTGVATRNSDNKVDNIEKVEIDKPDGLYQIIIKHKGNLLSGSQNYSLIISGISFCYTDDLYILTREKDNIETSNFVGTAKQIKASNVIKSNAQGIVYKASQSVELLPDASGGSASIGFVAEQGSIFMAYIDADCNSSDLNMVYHSQADRPAATDNPESTSTNPSTGNQDVKKQIENILIYPNPTKTEVNISYKVTSPSLINITILDLSGKVVYQQKSNEKFPMGTYQKRIQTDKLSQGTYMMVIETTDYRETKKIIIR
ncbi:S8/S53 family peptidase [Weeksellaceae bacterium A-14]